MTTGHALWFRGWAGTTWAGVQRARRVTQTLLAPSLLSIPLLETTLAFSTASFSLACTDFKPGTDVDIAPELAAATTDVDPRWACLGMDNGMVPPAQLGTDMVTYSIFIADTVTRLPPPGLYVNACTPLDVACQNPMAANVVPDPDGVVRIPVKRNFTGFLQVQSPGTVPAMLFLDGPVSSDMTASPMLVIGNDALNAIVDTQGFKIDPKLGNLLLYAYDCNQQPAPGVQFTSDRGGQPFAFVDTRPVLGETVTDDQGAAGFLNALPGSAVVTGMLSSSGTLVKKGSGQVQAGWFTYLHLDAKEPPSPMPNGVPGAN